MRTFMPEKGHGLNPVDYHMQIGLPIGCAKSFPRQTYVAGAVFDQENFHWPHNAPCTTGNLAIPSQTSLTCFTIVPKASHSAGFVK